MRGRGAAGLVLLALVAGGCDSTTRRTDTVAAVREPPLASSSPGSPDATADATAASTSPVGGSPRATRQAKSAVAGTGGARSAGVADHSEAGASGLDGAGVMVMGTGVTETEITLGFEVSTNLQAGFAAVGATGSPPDERDIVEALVEWVNGNGGIAGRRVVPVIHEVDRTRGGFTAQEEAACSTFTEDHQVFAAVSTPVTGNDALVACLAKKQTPLVDGGLFPTDDVYFSQYAGLLYQPARMSATRAGAHVVDGLQEQGWFDGTKTGLLRLDTPVFDRIADEVIKPRMAESGSRFTEEVAISAPASVAEFGAMNAQLGNAIVRFRRAGVTHLMIWEIQGAVSFFFMKEADSQGWRPVYGLQSYNIPATQAQQQPADQLATSVGVGWIPGVDTYAPEQPDNPARRQCTQIMQDAGIPLDYLTYSFYTHVHCDAVFFLKAALERAPEFTTAGLRAGVESLGDTFVGASTLSTRFEPGRYDGAASYQAFAFDVECACYRYTGSPRPAP